MSRGAAPDRSAIRQPLFTKTALCVQGQRQSSVCVGANAPSVREENEEAKRQRIPRQLQDRNTGEQPVALERPQDGTHIRLAPFPVLLNLRDLPLRLPALQRVIALPLALVVYRALVPSARSGQTPRSCTSKFKSQGEDTHRMYVKSIPAHDCNDATLATFASQLNTVFALPVP